MEVQLKVTPDLWIKFEADGQDEAFACIAKHQEVFGNTKCGACGNPNIKYLVRKATSEDKKEEYEYPELVCTDSKCRARLSFGHINNKSGDLFPQRKDKDKNFLPSNGWVVFKRENKE